MVFVWGWGGGPRRRRGYGPPPGFGRGGYGPGYGRGYGPGYGGGGGGCLRDLFLLNTGCCLAESLGCGPGLVLLAPSTLAEVRAERHASATDPAHEGGRVQGWLLSVIGVYQRRISPKHGPTCRFSPTCSAYGAEAIERHGAGRGSWLTARRLLRCRPGARGGADPVPA